MRRIIHKILSVSMTAVLLLSAASVPAFADEDYEKDSISIETKILKINGEGDVVLDLSPDALYDAGFATGDEVKVKIKEYDYSEKMPYFLKDSDSEPDEPALINDEDHASLSTAKGCFAEDEDLFTSEKGSDGKTVWKDEDGKSGTGVKVKVYLHEKGKYREQYDMRNPERTYSRSDYSSGKKYANFRKVTAGAIGDKVLYRSSSPINDSIGRADYAAKEMEKAGIKTVINLSDSKNKVEKYIKESGNTYYKKLFDRGSVAALDLSFDFDSDEFRKGICSAVKFMSEHEGPYLIHCTEGKDRTGFLSALLEALMGASPRELSDDYLRTYRNFYHYNSGSDGYKYAKNEYLKEIYRAIAGAGSNSELKGLDFHNAAYQYLTKGGVTDDIILKLTEKLKGNGENGINILAFKIGNDNIETAVGNGGVLNAVTGDRVIATYTGSKVRPGTSSIIVNGVYMYNNRDYTMSFKDNVHAGKMTATVKFKKKTDVYGSGIKKMVLSYTIAPKSVTEADIKVRLNKKKTSVKSVRDLGRDARIKKKYYAADMVNKRITFKGDYSGTVSFK